MYYLCSVLNFLEFLTHVKTNQRWQKKVAKAEKKAVSAKSLKDRTFT